MVATLVADTAGLLLMTEDEGPSRASRHYWYLGLTLSLMVAGLALFWFATQVLLLAFAGILGGVLLDALVSPLAEHTRIKRPIALALVVLTSIGLSVGLGFLLGSPLQEQFTYMSEELPPVFRTMAEGIEKSRIGESILEPLPTVESMVTGPKVVGGVTGLLSSIAGGLGGALFIVVVSIFLALRPSAYIDPIVRVAPLHLRGTVVHLVQTWGSNLRHWLVARFASMLAVGLLTGLGLWLVGIPAAASLGVLAGVLSFIPNLGPTIAALPGIFLGMASSPTDALWAAGVYIGVQILEGNFITPFAEQRAVSLPPAFLITVQLLMGLLAGILGLLIATPLVVVIILAVRELYLERLEPAGGLVEIPPNVSL